MEEWVAGLEERQVTQAAVEWWVRRCTDHWMGRERSQWRREGEEAAKQTRKSRSRSRVFIFKFYSQRATRALARGTGAFSF